MEAITAKAKKIKLLICDLDGVLTDGYLVYQANGDSQKSFHVHDGLGLKLLQKSGVKVAIITTSNSALVEKRMHDLQIDHFYMGQVDKAPAYRELLETYKLDPTEVAYVGDDLPDLPIIKHCGLGIAVANAVTHCRKHADWVTEKTGGHGAVREICEFIMQAQDTADSVLAKYHEAP